jgi:hypothetical protein
MQSQLNTARFRRLVLDRMFFIVDLDLIPFQKLGGEVVQCPKERRTFADNALRFKDSVLHRLCPFQSIRMKQPLPSFIEGSTSMGASDHPEK